MKKIIPILFAASLFAISCEHEDPVRDSLYEKAGNLQTVSDVQYDDMYSRSDVLSVFWNGQEAIKAGASEFEIRISEELVEEGVEGDELTYLTYKVKVRDIPNDEVHMSEGIVPGTAYYVKVAACYPGPSTSAWTYLLGPDGKPAQVIPGEGIK